MSGCGGYAPYNDVGVPNVGGGWLFDVGVHTPLQTMGGGFIHIRPGFQPNETQCVKYEK